MSSSAYEANKRVTEWLASLEQPVHEVEEVASGPLIVNEAGLNVSGIGEAIPESPTVRDEQTDAEKDMEDVDDHIDNLSLSRAILKSK